VQRGFARSAEGKEVLFFLWLAGIAALQKKNIKLWK
jgi:hypothetical protein